MNIRPFEKKTPVIDSSSYIDPTAVVIGDVVIGKDCSVWPMTVIRGDVNSIRIGDRSNIQDSSVLHVNHAGEFNPEGDPLVIGDDVTVGHRVTLHGCTVGDRCLIGIGSIVMDGAIVESEVIIGAGSLVPRGKVLTSGYLWLGSPVKQIRPLTAEEISFLSYSAEHYSQLKDRY